VGELIHHATILLQDVNEQVGALLIRWAGLRFKPSGIRFEGLWGHVLVSPEEKSKRQPSCHADR
jgi:hypothetical protein